MIRAPAKAAKTFEHPRGHVGGRWIELCVVVGKRNVAEETLVVVAIERGPTAVAILHAEQPLDAAADSRFHARRIREFAALRGNQYERSFVHVGIKIIPKLEDPPAGRGVLVFTLPVAGSEDLFRQNPLR